MAWSVKLAKEALDELKRAADENAPYQIVILDQAMSEMNGLELAQKIKDFPQLSNTKFIMLTSVAHTKIISNRSLCLTANRDFKSGNLKFKQL